MAAFYATLESRPRPLLQCRYVFKVTREFKRAATHGRHPSPHVRPDPRRCGLGQNPRAHDAHCVALNHRASEPVGRIGGDLHQQGRKGNADAALVDGAAKCAHHVDGHISRVVQPFFAHALARGEPAANVHHHGHAGAVVADQAHPETKQYRRRKVSTETVVVVYLQRQRRRLASEPRRSV